MWDPHPSRVRWRYARTTAEAFRGVEYADPIERPAPRRIPLWVWLGLGAGIAWGLVGLMR